MRGDQRPLWRDPDTGYVREQISSVPTNTARGDRNPEITRVTLPPDARVPFPSDAFYFISQAIWVLQGTLHFVEWGHVHQLEKDDCLTLGDPTDCVFENRSDLPCIYVVVVTWRRHRPKMMRPLYFVLCISRSHDVLS
ncbi:MAG: cupin domain-containing protein [Pseudomonadota bacterium]